MTSGLKNTFILFCVLIGLLSACTTDYDNPVSPIIGSEQSENLSHIDAILSHTTQFNPEDILVVFDFNYTLMYPTIPCLHKNNIDANKSAFKEILGQLSHEQADVMLSQMMATENQKLINDELSSFLKKYSEVNFIVCSSSLEKNADAYLKLLSRNNIKISNGYHLGNFKFSDFKEYLSGRPVYKNGIIVTNRRNKGEILVSFLKRISHKPKLIIFIDNSADKLEDVQAAVKSLKDTKLIIIEYLEYKNKAMKKVSEQEFRKYWNEQVKNFLRCEYKL